MSHTYSEFLPSYSVGVDCYKAIPEIVKPCDSVVLVAVPDVVLRPVASLSAPDITR